MILDHVGVAVESLDKSISLYGRLAGLKLLAEEEVASQRVRAAFLSAGEASIELLEPTGPEGPVAEFLRKRGPGLHHLAFRTSDIRSEMRRLSAEGLTPIETRPRPGARGREVCFLHPRHGGGVLVELVS